MSSIQKVKTIEEMEAIAEDLRIQQQRVVTTNGAYDILHVAHIHLLEKARALGDALVVLVNSDESVRKFKSKPDDPRPINPERERAEVLAALESVDYVTIFPQDKPLDYLARIKPHFHARGGSWDPVRLREEIEFVAQWGCEYRTFDLEPGYSSTNILETIRGKK